MLQCVAPSFLFLLPLARRRSFLPSVLLCSVPPPPPPPQPMRPSVRCSFVLSRSRTSTRRRKDKEGRKGEISVTHRDTIGASLAQNLAQNHSGPSHRRDFLKDAKRGGNFRFVKGRPITSMMMMMMTTTATSAVICCFCFRCHLARFNGTWRGAGREPTHVVSFAQCFSFCFSWMETHGVAIIRIN